MKPKTLLDRARAMNRKNAGRPVVAITDEHIELAIAWAKQEATMAQVRHAIGLEGDMNGGYRMIARAFALAMQRGMIGVVR